MSESYKNAGVDIEAGYEVVNRIKKHVKATNRLGVVGGIGAFGGLFNLTECKYKEPVLVSGTDGVGTKLLIAIDMDKHDTIGIDAVAMCVNDIISQGAEPLFFLDYLAVGKNSPEKIEAIVKGVSNGCVQSNCALIGGETAEMPDMYDANHYDIAGFAVGAVERSKMIDGSKTKAGDVLIGLKSSGVHSNGFSLVRKIILKDNEMKLDQFVEELGDTLGNTLLTPTKIYVKSILDLIGNVDVHGISHITGGGFIENIPRCLNNDLGVTIDINTFEILPIFKYLQKLANLKFEEMFNIFNMGIGMVVVVDEDDVEKTLEILTANNEEPVVIGKVKKGEGVSLNI